MEARATVFLPLSLILGTFDVLLAINGGFAVPALPGSRNNARNCGPFPTNGSQLFHALEGAFDNIQGVGLKHSSFFTPSGLLSFSQLDRKHWPISEGQFFDNFVAVADPRRTVVEAELREDSETTPPQDLQLEVRRLLDLEKGLKRRQKELEVERHKLRDSQAELEARRHKQVTAERRLQDLEEDLKRRHVEREKKLLEVKDLDAQLEERRQQDPEEDLTIRQRELEVKIQNLRDLEEDLGNRTKVYEKAVEQLVQEERELQHVEDELTIRLQELEENSVELDILRADLRRKLDQLQCLVIGSTETFGDFIKTESFQSRVCRESVPFCWETSTQFGTPNPIGITGPEGGVEKACNRRGSQGVYRVINHVDMYRLWRHLYRAGDDQPVWIHGFRTNTSEHEPVTLDDFYEHGTYCGAMMSAGGQVLSVDCSKSGIYYVCDDVHHIRLINYYHPTPDKL